MSRGKAGHAGTIALLTDFGLQDVYVGVVKGVLATRAPGVSVIDLTHDVAPGDVRMAAFRLWQAYRYMPPGTIFLCVVDPGVGSARRAVAAMWAGFLLVGPDNGVFSWLIPDGADVLAVAIDPARLGVGPPRPTFHGRDIFAPAAAMLAAGASPDSLGERVGMPGGLIRISYPRLSMEVDEVRGEIICTDRFGNLLTSIGILDRRGDDLALKDWTRDAAPVRLPGARLRVGLPDGTWIPLGRTFSDVGPGSPIAYVGSDGLLEIGVNGGSAAASFGLTPGAEILLRRDGAGRERAPSP